MTTARAVTGGLPTSEYNRRYYAAHRDHRRAQGRAYAKANYQRFKAQGIANHEKRKSLLRAFADAERARGCVDCGTTTLGVIDLDHVRGHKIANIAYMIVRTVPLARFLEELDKCEPRCANCHRLITAERLKEKKGGVNRNDARPLVSQG